MYECTSDENFSLELGEIQESLSDNNYFFNDNIFIFTLE